MLEVSKRRQGLNDGFARLQVKITLSSKLKFIKNMKRQLAAMDLEVKEKNNLLNQQKKDIEAMEKRIKDQHEWFFPKLQREEAEVLMQ